MLTNEELYQEFPLRGLGGLMLCSIQKTASCVDILTARCADGCRYAVSVEIVAEVLHCLLVATLKVNVRNLVIADEVDAAVKPAQ